MLKPYMWARFPKSQLVFLINHIAAIREHISKDRADRLDFAPLQPTPPDIGCNETSLKNLSNDSINYHERFSDFLFGNLV